MARPDRRIRAKDRRTQEKSSLEDNLGNIMDSIDMKYLNELELLKDITELQKCYYQVLKRNVELFEKLTKLEEETVDLRRTTTSQSHSSTKD